MFSFLSKTILVVSLLYFSQQTLFAQNNDSTFRVDSIVVKGNKKTRTFIILRELSFRMGDTIQNWSYHKEQSRKQLINLFLFNEISINKIASVVYIDVTERWYFWPSPELDYADRNFNQWWLSKDPKRLIYGLNLEWFNVRGRNETMVLGLIAGYTRMAALSYKIPYFNKKQTWGLFASVHYSTNKEVWFKTENDKVQFFRDNDKDLIKRKNAELIITHRKRIFNYHHFSMGYRQTEIDDTVSDYDVNQRYLLYNQTIQREQYIGYQFVFDRRDFKGFPLNGHLLKIHGEASNYYFNIKDFQTLMLKLSYSKYFKIRERLFASFNVSGRYYSNQYPQYSRVQALGYGREYIRGYELYVIDGSHFGLAKAELKYRFLNKKYKFFPKVKNYEVLPISLFVSTFYDAGYVVNKDKQGDDMNNNVLTNSLQKGYGAGLNIVAFYDYCARIEYAFDSFGKSRFYLSFVAAM